MEALLTLPRIKIENANAIAGLTYGFPAVSHFLGFVHALSRELKSYGDFNIHGCAIICHSHQVHAYPVSGWGDQVFALTRNPVDQKGDTAAFVEEGRMHLVVSLLIECDFDESDIERSEFKDIDSFSNWLVKRILKKRLAGGHITALDNIGFEDWPDEPENFIKKKLLSLLPGFALVDRTDYLKQHAEREKEDSNIELFDAWLDFSKLVYKAHTDDNNKVTWHHCEKPAPGYLVPIMTGYKGISPLYEAGTVNKARDHSYPFQFVEPIYSIGEWLSPHRAIKPSQFKRLFWHYQCQNDWYLCCNNQ